MFAPIILQAFEFKPSVLRELNGTWPNLHKPIGTPTAIHVLNFLKKYDGIVIIRDPQTSKVLGQYFFDGVKAKP